MFFNFLEEENAGSDAESESADLPTGLAFFEKEHNESADHIQS